MSLQTLLTIALVIGALAGATLLFRSPTVYFQFGAMVFEKLRPVIITYMLKRMTPEEEKRYQESVRRGQEWDPFRKRPRDK